LLADKLANQALDEARKKEEEILKKARVEAEDILSKAHASRDQLAKEMEIAASKKVVDFAAELLRNIYDDKMKALIHGQFIKNFMDQAKKSDLASVDLRDQRPILRTAIALTKEDQEPLRKVLAERLGSPDLQLEETVDEKLIAGVALQIGTLSLDGSFANAVRESANLVKEKIQD
jgi:F0F1-type ATP synthase delta subunit